MPSPSAAPSLIVGTLCAEGLTSCDIRAGTYAAAPFEPDFTFEVAAGWRNDRAYPDGGGISTAQGGFLWASNVASGTDGASSSRDAKPVAPGVDGFLDHIRGYAGFTISDPTPIEVDGAKGLQVDVETNDIEAPGFFFIEKDAFNLTPGEKVRFIVLDKGETTVVLIIDSFQAAGFDAVLDMTTPVLDSVRWEEP